MEKITKAALFLGVIETMFDVINDKEVDRSELIDALSILGFNSMELLYETNTIEAFQKVCGAFAEIELTPDDLANLERV